MRASKPWPTPRSTVLSVAGSLVLSRTTAAAVTSGARTRTLWLPLSRVLVWSTPGLARTQTQTPMQPRLRTHLPSRARRAPRLLRNPSLSLLPFRCPFLNPPCMLPPDRLREACIWACNQSYSVQLGLQWSPRCCTPSVRGVWIGALSEECEPEVPCHALLLMYSTIVVVPAVRLRPPRPLIGSAVSPYLSLYNPRLSVLVRPRSTYSILSPYPHFLSPGRPCVIQAALVKCGGRPVVV